MKKFKYAIGIAAMALFGACSSDAPEVIDNADEGSREGMYLQIQLADCNSTRAVADNNGEVEGSPTESAIKDVQLIITDSKNIELANAVSYIVETGGLARFTVSTNEFNFLKAKAAANEELNIYVYANGIANGVPEKGLTYSQLYSGKTSVSAWDATKGFLMSNGVAVKRKLTNPTVDGLSEANAWEISGDAVPLTRLAVRFDEVNSTNTFTADSDEAVTFTFLGMSVVTHAKNVYRLPQFSANGTISGMAPFKESSRPYAVTDAQEENFEVLAYNAHTYELDGTKKTIYKFPNSIFSTLDADYDSSPYVAIKTKFDSPRIATSKSTGADVYVLNGILLGGIAEIKAMNHETGLVITPKATYAENSAEAAQISNALALFNGWMHSQDWTKSDADILSRMKQVVPGIMTFKATNVGTDETPSYEYHTYYAKLIVHDESQTVDALKYNILRNHVYNLGIQSIGFIGCTSGQQPGDGPTITKNEEMYIKMKISVNKWQVIGLNSNMNL